MKPTSPLVVHLSTSDLKGGAAIAAYRLMKAQRSEGVNAVLLVLDKTSSDPHVFPLIKPSRWNKARALAAKILEVLLAALAVKRLRGFQLFALSIPYFGFNVMKHPLCKQAEVLHLHYTNGGFLSLHALKQIAKAGKKVFFTLHDIWHVAAICHYTTECVKEGFELATPYAKGFLAKQFAHNVYSKKELLYKAIKPRFIGCSQWIVDVAKRSRLAKDYPITHIPNIPDFQHFSPSDRKEARQRLALPTDRPIILYGAANTSDERKGYKELKEMLNAFAKSKNVQARPPLLVVFGKANEENFSKKVIGIESRLVGYIRNATEMALYYTASDLFLSTSRMDNLPNTLIEAQLCNCPSLAFAVGGIPEIIQTPDEGILIPQFDTLLMAEKLEAFLYQMGNDSQRPRPALRSQALLRYDTQRIVEKHLNAYQLPSQK